MRSLLKVQVKGRQLARLQQMYREARSPRTGVRVQMVLLSHDGYSLDEIAHITRHSDETVRRWLHRFIKEGCRGLLEEVHPGRSPQITPAVEEFLKGCILNRSPREFRLSRPTWTTDGLAKAVKRKFRITVTDECIRQHLERLDIVCRRPTWTVKHLAKQRPGYAQKKGQLLDF